MGYYGTGTFNQSGGTNTPNALYLAYYSGSNGTYNLNGGTLIVKSLASGSGTASFNLGGGTLQAGWSLSISVPMTLTGTGGDGRINTAGYSVTISSILSGSGGLNKFGSNTLTLSANNTYNGVTTVSAGTLALSTNGKISNSSTINVASGATFNVSAVSGGFSLGASQTLKGSGTVVGNLTVNGIHAPGNSPGVETIQGNYNMFGQLQMELKGTTAGSGYDQVLLNGSTHNATLGGSLSLDWTGINGSTNTTELWILNNTTAGTLTGTFGNYSNGADLGSHDGREWYLWYGADFATGNLTGGNDVVVAAVPEPSTLVLLFVGVGLVVFSRRLTGNLETDRCP